jgi:hypothetical protein
MGNTEINRWLYARPSRCTLFPSCLRGHALHSDAEPIMHDATMHIAKTPHANLEALLHSPRVSGKGFRGRFACVLMFLNSVSGHAFAAILPICPGHPGALFHISYHVLRDRQNYNKLSSSWHNSIRLAQGCLLMCVCVCVCLCVNLRAKRKQEERRMLA